MPICRHIESHCKHKNRYMCINITNYVPSIIVHMLFYISTLVHVHIPALNGDALDVFFNQIIYFPSCELRHKIFHIQDHIGKYENIGFEDIRSELVLIAVYEEHVKQTPPYEGHVHREHLLCGESWQMSNCVITARTSLLCYAGKS